jgi:hypothetical protein
MFRCARRLLLPCLFAACLASPVWCADLPPLIPRATFTHASRRDRPSLSPDGKWLAYLAPVEGVANIWVREVGGTNDRTLTAEKIRVAFYWWQGDGEHLLYSRDQGGDENWHLFQVNLKTGLTRGGKSTPPDKRHRHVIILDQFESAASVKVVMTDWIDYMHMAKFNGKWVIVNVLWESKPKLQ